MDFMEIKYRQLAERLKQELENYIRQGTYKLPTEKELCEQFHASRQTIRQALLILEQEGLIARKQGSGSYVTGLLPEREKNHVAILLSTDTEYIFPALLGDLETLLSKEGYSVSVYITHNRTDVERTILQSLAEAPLRGLIAEPSRSGLPTPNFDLYEKLSAQGAHIVFFHGYYSNLPPSSYVKDDNYAGGYTLGQFLINQRHRQIAGIFQLDTIQGQERHLGCTRAMLEAGLPIDEDTVAWFTTEQLVLLQKKQDTRFLSDFIQRNLKSCSAVICHNDEIAYWLIKELTYKNIRIPEDLSVVCFDNSYLNDLSPIQITSLSHKQHEMGTVAAESILKLMKGSPITSQKLPWHLTIKRSAGAPPSEGMNF